MLDTVPFEVLENIVSFLYDSYGSELHRTAASLCLVSRSLHKKALPLLYQHLSYDQVEKPKLLNTLAAKPELGLLVQSIQLDVEPLRIICAESIADAERFRRERLLHGLSVAAYCGNAIELSVGVGGLERYCEADKEKDASGFVDPYECPLSKTCQRDLVWFPLCRAKTLS